MAGWDDIGGWGAGDGAGGREPGRGWIPSLMLTTGLLALATFAGLTVTGVVGGGGSGDGDHDRAAASGEPVANGARAGGARAGGDGAADDTTTTVPELVAGHYEPGDCVTWDPFDAQVDPGRRYLNTEVVPCTTPHRIQITRPVEVTAGGSYPTEERWDELHDSECGPAAARFLGRPLDPHGRYVANSIVPTRRSWQDGDRTMWCGIGNYGAPGTNAELVSEDVRHADQAYSFAPGDCVADQPIVDWPQAVACTTRHQKEILGQIDLSSWEVLPTTADHPQLFAECDRQAEAYLGGAPPPQLQVLMEAMPAESWEAGSRVIHCFLGQRGPGGELSVLTTPARG